MRFYTVSVIGSSSGANSSISEGRRKADSAETSTCSCIDHGALP